MEEKFIGLLLAVSSSILIGSSFIITKKGLIDASSGGRASDNLSYLHNLKWWAGMITMVCGELANFAAYSYAPAILVTPLGALSVLISSLLAVFFLGEKLGTEGIIGCALCLLGSVIIVLHAPEEINVTSVDEILDQAQNPYFLTYIVLVTIITLYFYIKLCPSHGKKTPLVYIVICSLVGSVSVMACKGFGIAIKLTIEGSNQLIYPSTYFFGIVVALCVVIQMNYFNKALDLFSTNVVTPIYYVFFTTATILASLALFEGFHQASVVDTLSAFSGFIVIFIGVYMLNVNKRTVGGSFDKLDQTRDGQSLALEVKSTDHGFDQVELGLTEHMEEL